MHELRESAPSQPSFDRVARQASIRFSGLAFDKFLGYAFALVVAKTYGSTAFGLYLFGVGAIEVLFALSQLGLERSSIRAVAHAEAQGKPSEIPGIVRASLELMLPLGVALGVLVVALGPWVSARLGRPELGPFLQIAAIAIPSAQIANAYLWTTEGLGSQRFDTVVRLVVEPLIKVSLSLVFFVALESIPDAVALALAYAIAIATSAVLGYVCYARYVAPLATGPSVEKHAAELFRLGLPSCGLTLFQRLLQWWDIFLTFTFVSTIATTHYAVAYRTAALTIMISSSVDSAFKPAIASALARNERDLVRREFDNVARAVLVLCLPAVVMLIAFSDRIMPVLGDQFIPAAPISAIVAIGTLVSLLVGPAASALNMSGRTRIPFVNGLIAGSIGVVTGLALVRQLGTIGVAIGQCVSMCIANLLHATAARRLVGVGGLGRRHIQLAIAAVAAFAAGYGANTIAPANKYAAFAVVGAAVCGAYLAVLLLLGRGIEEWRFFRTILHRSPDRSQV